MQNIHNHRIDQEALKISLYTFWAKSDTTIIFTKLFL